MVLGLDFDGGGRVGNGDWGGTSGGVENMMGVVCSGESGRCRKTPVLT